MTPDALRSTWLDGVPSAGHLILTFDPRVSAQDVLVDVINTRMAILASTLLRGLQHADKDLSLMLDPVGPVRENTLRFAYAFSRPALDAMAYLLSGVEAMDRDAGGLLTALDVTSSDGAQWGAGTVLPQITDVTPRDAMRRPLSNPQAKDLLGAAVVLVIPNPPNIDEGRALHAMRDLAAMVEEGCFGPSDAANDLSEAVVGHDPDKTELHMGVTGYRCEPELCRALVAVTASALGLQPGADPLVIISDDTA